MYIDTHCHLSKNYYDNIDEIINEDINNNVEKIIISSCEKESQLECIELIKKYDFIYATIGYHPEEAKKTTVDDMKVLEKLIEKNEKIIGIGEIGLDYHYDKDNKELQQQLFEKQLDIAEKYELPVVIHSRDATEDTINILKKYKLKGIIHCFSGSLETAKIYLNMGYKLGIGGVVTFKNSSLYKVIEQLSLNDIVLETDSPYLTPEPYRGKKNSSKYIPIIAKKIADIKKTDVVTVGKITTKNCQCLFDLK